MCVTAQAHAAHVLRERINHGRGMHRAVGRQSSDNKRWQASQNMPRSSRLGQSVAEEALLRRP